MDDIKLSYSMRKRFLKIESAPSNREEFLVAFMRGKQAPTSPFSREALTRLEKQLDAYYRDNPLFFLMKVRSGRSLNITLNDFDEQILVANRLVKRHPLQSSRFNNALALVHRAAFIIHGRPSDKIGMKKAIEELKKDKSDPWSRLPRAVRDLQRLDKDRDSYVSRKLVVW